MKKSKIIKKSLLTGFIYTVMTCIVQVPIANIVFSIFNIEPDSFVGENELLILLLTIFIVGIAMSIFYYLFGYLFKSKNKLLHGLKFAIFIYAANYIPQVFFLDATDGFTKLISGGFPVIQVELFDLIILIATVLIMVCYMPYKNIEIGNKKKSLIKDIVAGIIFSIVLITVNEFILPLFGFTNMADGLNVSKENMLFFYGVMTIGFILTGYLVSYFSNKQNLINNKNSLCIMFGILIWCVFDLTMIPLGFGLVPTILFIVVSMISFLVLNIYIKHE